MFSSQELPEVQGDVIRCSVVVKQPRFVQPQLSSLLAHWMKQTLRLQSTQSAYSSFTLSPHSTPSPVTFQTDLVCSRSYKRSEFAVSNKKNQCWLLLRDEIRLIFDIFHYGYYDIRVPTHSIYCLPYWLLNHYENHKNKSFLVVRDLFCFILPVSFVYVSLAYTRLFEFALFILTFVV